MCASDIFSSLIIICVCYFGEIGQIKGQLLRFDCLEKHRALFQNSPFTRFVAVG